MMPPAAAAARVEMMRIGHGFLRMEMGDGGVWEKREVEEAEMHAHTHMTHDDDVNLMADARERQKEGTLMT